MEARLRDCDNSSFSVSTDDERDKSEFETALQEDIKEEKGEGAVVALFWQKVGWFCRRNGETLLDELM